MKKSTENDNSPDSSQYPSHQVRLPGFINDKEIGLGDVVKRTTTYLGIKPCGGCEQRRNTLNQWMVFTPPRSR